jgi:zinc protease
MLRHLMLQQKRSITFAPKWFFANCGSVTSILLLPLLFCVTSCTKKNLQRSDTTQTSTVKHEGLQLPIETLVLGNGLRVVVNKDPTTTFATINLAILAGSGRELPGEEGAAYLLQYLLFQAGSGVEGQVLQQFEAVGADIAGGAVSSSVDYDRMVLTSTLPASGVPWALWLESKRLQGFLSGISEEVFLKQKSYVKESLLQAQQKPYGMQNDLISRNLYPKAHPYGHPVTASPAEISRLSLHKVQGFYTRNFTPQNAVLTVSGNVEPSDVISSVKTYFNQLRPQSASTQIISDNSISEPKLIVHRSDAPAKQVFVWKGPGYFSGDLAAINLATELLAGSKNSILHQTLVQTKKIASRVEATVYPSRLSSEIVIEIYPQKKEDTDLITRSLQQLLQEISTTGPGETDVATAKAKGEFALLASLETSFGSLGKANRLAAFYLFGLDSSQLVSEYENIVSQTPNSIRQAIGSWLAKEPALEIRFLPTDFDQANVVALITAPALRQEPIPTFATSFTRKVLANGIDLIVFNRPESQNIEIDLVIKTADLYEATERSGVSLLTAKAVLAGTKSRSAFQIENAVNSFGGHLNSDGSKFGSKLSINGLKRHLEGMYELLADVAINPVFPETELAAVKKIVADRLSRELQNPQQHANLMFNKILFAGGHPGGLPVAGTPALTSRLNQTQIKEHHQKYWIPNNAAIIVSGPVTLAEAEKLTNKHFAFWSTRTLDAVTLQEQPGPDRTYTFIAEVPGTNETIVRMGSVAPYRGQSDETALQLLNQILSRRYQTQVDRFDRFKSVPNSTLSMNRHFGYWMQTASTNKEQALALVTHMRQNLESLSGSSAKVSEMGPSGITGEELAKAQSELARNFLKSFETSAQINKITAGLVSFGLGPEALNRFIPDLYQQTPATLKALAERYFSPSRQIILFYGDTAGLEQQLKKQNAKDLMILDQDGKFLRKSGS